MLDASGVNAVGVTNEPHALADPRHHQRPRDHPRRHQQLYGHDVRAGLHRRRARRRSTAFGTGTTGSRIANGTYAMHRELERELASFLGRKHCIVFTTGYQANLGMIAGLAGPKDTIYLDADSHSSIYDGCTLSRRQAGALPPQ